MDCFIVGCSTRSQCTTRNLSCCPSVIMAILRKVHVLAYLSLDGPVVDHLLSAAKQGGSGIANCSLITPVEWCLHYVHGGTHQATTVLLQMKTGTFIWSIFMACPSWARIWVAAMMAWTRCPALPALLLVDAWGYGILKLWLWEAMRDGPRVLKLVDP